MSTDGEEVANTVNIADAKRNTRKGILWISDIAASEYRFLPPDRACATMHRLYESYNDSILAEKVNRLLETGLLPA